MLYYIHQTPLSSWRIEGGSGDETTSYPMLLVPTKCLGMRLDQPSNNSQILTVGLVSIVNQDNLAKNDYLGFLNIDVT